jgi:hypothetical protein
VKEGNRGNDHELMGEEGGVSREMRRSDRSTVQRGGGESADNVMRRNTMGILARAMFGGV